MIPIIPDLARVGRSGTVAAAAYPIWYTIDI